MNAKLWFQAFGLRKECDARVRPDFIPQFPGLGHVPHVLFHYGFGGEEAKDGQLGKAAEKKLFLAGALEPPQRLFEMHVPAPQQREPDVRIKEIQRVHIFVR